MYYEQTETIDLLAAALSAAQGEMEDAEKNSVNPHFRSRYANLSAVREAVRAPFAKHGLAYSQWVVAIDGGIGVVTVLMHKSGQWMRGVTPLVGRLDTPQAMGSAVTYARRYGLQSMAGLAADDDDDGHAASQTRPTPAIREAPRREGPRMEGPTDARPFLQWISARVSRANEEWARVETERGVSETDRRSITSDERAINAIASAALKAGEIRETDVKRGETGGRNLTLTKQAMARLWAKDQMRVAAALDAYLGKKLADNEAALAVAGEPGAGG